MQSILTVTTPAVSFALTRVDTVKAELGITGSAEDSQIDAFIWQASSAITGYLGRVLAYETVSEQFRLPAVVACRGYLADPNGPEPLILDRYPVSDIASVVVDGTTLSGSEYEVDPASGRLWRLSADCMVPWRGRKITIRYTGGYQSLPDLPDAIEDACIRIVKAKWFAAKRDPLIRAENIDGVLQTQYWVPSKGEGVFPAGVTELLDPFLNPFIA
jgi:hypothetical protein